MEKNRIDRGENYSNKRFPKEIRQSVQEFYSIETKSR